jgi:hypothetical protein
MKIDPLSVFFYLLIILLPTQLSKHWFLFPTQTLGLRVDYLSISLYLTDIILIALIATYVRKHGIKMLTNKYALLIFFFNLLQLLWSKTPAIHLYLSFKFYFLIIFFQICVNFKYNKKLIAKIFSFQAVFLFFLTLAQAFKQSSIGGIFYWIGERGFNKATPQIALENMNGKLFLRPYATFSHPNVLAAYTLIVFWFISFYFVSKNQNQKIFKFISQICCLLAIFLTFSLNALLAVILGGLILLLGKKTYTLKNFKLFLFLSFLVPIALLFINFTQLESLVLRNNLMSAFFQNLNLNIVLGYGWWGNLINLIKNYNISDFKPWIQPVHHSWYLIVSTMGLLPLLLIYSDIQHRCNMKNIKIDKNKTIILLSIIFTGSFDHYWFSQSQTLLLLVFVLADIFKPCQNLKK